MTASRVAIVVLGSALLTSWLVVAGTATHQPRRPLPVPPAAETEPHSSNLEIQTERLRQRQAQTPAPRSAGRNPFVFAARATETQPPPAPDLVAAAIDEPPVPAGPAVPGVALVGIATDADERTAVLSVAGEIVLAHPGDTIAGRYRVVAVTADVVVLEDLLGGPSLRVTLR